MISRNDFPLLTTHKNLIYLDNAATTQKPNILMEALTHYYITANANVGRGAYDLANTSEALFEQSRKDIADFFGGKQENLVFTSGATESLNLAAHIVSRTLNKGDSILVSVWDHHANLLPWQQQKNDNKDISLIFIDNLETMYNPENLPEKFWENIKVIAIPHVSNVTGNIFPVEKWVKEAKKRNIITIIDAAQAVSSMKVNVDEIGADFYAFSAHKLYGPMGLGCLFVNPKFHDGTPLILGGGIIEYVNQQEFNLIGGKDRFDAGTPDVANAYAFAQTLKWLTKNNWETNLKDIKVFNQILLDSFKDNRFVKILNNLEYPHIAMTTLSFKGIHSHDMGTFLATNNIAVRVGKHCAHLLYENLNEKHSVRFSLGIYNTQEEIENVKLAIIQGISYFKD